MMYKLLSSLSLLRSNQSAGGKLLVPVCNIGRPDRKTFLCPAVNANSHGLFSSFSTTAIAFSSTGSSIDPSNFVLKLFIPTAEELEEVGTLLATFSNPPDTIFLDGGT